MSAISGFINTIRNAVYGEQVRGAIISALEACYSDVNAPSLQTAAFTAALNAAYAGGILDIQTVTQISSMTNQQIIYRYNGTQAGYQKGLYYYSALSSSWVLIGSEVHSVSLSSQMTDTNAIYKYTGTQTGMVQNSLYCYNGTAWVPIGSGVLTASTASQMTNTEAIYKYTGTQTGYVSNALYYYNGTSWIPLASSDNVVSFSDVFTNAKNGLVPKPNVTESAKYTITGYPNDNNLAISDSSVTVTNLGASATWKGFSVGSEDVSFTFGNGLLHILIGIHSDYFLTIYPDSSGSWNVYRLSRSGNGNDQLASGVFTNMSSPLTTETHIELEGSTLSVTQASTTKTYSLSSYPSYDFLLGFVFSDQSVYQGRGVSFSDGEIGGRVLAQSVLSTDGWTSLSSLSDWKNKKWYAYGTSLTNISSEGKYPTYLAQISGMVLTNKGISGGKIVGANANIKAAVMNTTDGKLNADLITLEVGANDTSEVLGTIYDTGNDTFCGCLNQCIRYLQANTNAQIVVLSSTQSRYYLPSDPTPQPPETTFGSDNHTKFDQWEAIRKVCEVNGCYYIPMGDGCGLGYARMSDDYLVDQIHHTALGGYNIAQGIWGYLKNIPLWYTSIPS